MIKVNIKKDNNIKEIIITGHADYDDYGKDIVCAAASAVVITSVNAIENLDKEYIKCTQEENKLTIVVKKSNDTVQKLLNNMLSMLEELKKDYPKHIKLNEEVS